MQRRWLPCLALLGLLAFPILVRAADSKPAPPTLIVRVESVDALLADFKYLAALGDQEEVVKQFEGLLKSVAGPKGIEGVDPKRPLGLYATVGTQVDDSSAVGMIPVADEKALVGLLEKANLKPEKGKDGLYTLKVDKVPFPLYFRFANGYAYVTILHEAALDKDGLLTPAQVLPADQVGTASASLRLDRIDDTIKQLAVLQLALRLADVRDRQFAGNTKAEKEFGKQAFEELSADIGKVLRDGQEVSLKMDVDRKKDEVALEVTLTCKDGSKLATTIGDLGQSKSAFGGLLGSDLAVQGLLNLSLPEKVRQALEPIIDESLAKDLDKEANKERREAARQFIKALEPSLKAGRLDTAVALRAPAGEGKHHTLVLGVRLVDGVALDKALHDLVGKLPAGDQEKIKLDAEPAGTAKVHRVESPKDLPAKHKEAFGEGPVYLAIRADALLLAMGDNALLALREAVAAGPGTAAPVQFEVSLARLASAIAIDRQDPSGAVTKAAQDAFGKDKGNDRVRLVVEGGKSLHARFEVKAGVVKFIGLLDKAEKSKEK